MMAVSVSNLGRFLKWVRGSGRVQDSVGKLPVAPLELYLRRGILLPASEDCSYKEVGRENWPPLGIEDSTAEKESEPGERTNL